VCMVRGVYLDAFGGDVELAGYVGSPGRFPPKAQKVLCTHASTHMHAWMPMFSEPEAWLIRFSFITRRASHFTHCVRLDGHSC